MQKIPYGRQSVDQSDIDAVTEVLGGDWLTQGPTIEAFERAIADRVGARHAVAFSSGTAGLHACTSVAGLGPGDLVVTSPLTFMASANCARYVGADVGLVDIDSETLNLDLNEVPGRAEAVVRPMTRSWPESCACFEATTLGPAPIKAPGPMTSRGLASTTG